MVCLPGTKTSPRYFYCSISLHRIKNISVHFHHLSHCITLWLKNIPWHTVFVLLLTFRNVFLATEVPAGLKKEGGLLSTQTYRTLIQAFRKVWCCIMSNLLLELACPFINITSLSSKPPFFQESPFAPCLSKAELSDLCSLKKWCFLLYFFPTGWLYCSAKRAAPSQGSPIVSLSTPVQ